MTQATFLLGLVNGMPRHRPGRVQIACGNLIGPSCTTLHGMTEAQMEVQVDAYSSPVRLNLLLCFQLSLIDLVTH